MELEKYNPASAATLLGEIEKFCLSKGIILQRNSNSKIADKNWIRKFIIQTDAPPFYLEINSPSDIEKINGDLNERLENLQRKVKNFLQNNGAMNKNLQDKINTLGNKLLDTAKRYIKFGLKNSLQRELKNCNNIEDLRDAAGKCYGEFIKKELLERVFRPLYDELRQKPNDAAYSWLLNGLNQILASLGVMTVNVKIGGRYDENQPYIPAEKFITSNPQEKDIICAVVRYAYAFTNERIISEGKLIVAKFQQGGAK